MQSNSGLHVGIIMDGNGRWASSRGLPRWAGHVQGVEAARRATEAAPELGIRTLTLYAFSADNWKRPVEEVSAIFRLFDQYLERETQTCRKRGLRLEVIGRRDRISPALRQRIEWAEQQTARGTNLHLRLAIDYSSREAILRAAETLLRKRRTDRESFSRALGGCDTDLVIRTAGEQRLSDFLLWESAYAELMFLPVLWPDFDRSHLEQAISDFSRRERRFGGLNPLPAPAAIELAG
jgi:undecaprenyl diphosphate synthase